MRSHCIRKIIQYFSNGIWTLPGGKTVPSIACAQVLTEDKHTAPVPTTDTDVATIGGVHISFEDQTDPRTLHGTISLAYTTNTSKDTGSSTGLSGRRIQNRNIPRTINIHRRQVFRQ